MKPGIFYLYPNRKPSTTQKPPHCWCHARAAWACFESPGQLPEPLCSVHAAEWALKRELPMPATPAEVQR